jgi:4'-phosphopantetheinyl transferase EntD
MGSQHVDSKRLAQLFCRPVAAVAKCGPPTDHLLPEEAVLVRTADVRRKQEFAAGRCCARLALRELGADPAAILADPRGMPIWPPGLVGSISHCEGYYCAVLARQSDAAAVGVDVECLEPFEPSLASLIMSEDETDQGSRLPSSTRRILPNLIFGAKEAFYKAQFQLTGTFLEFSDVRIRAHCPESWCEGTFEVFIRRANLVDLGVHIFGRWKSDGQFMFAGVTLTRGCS